MIISAFDGFIPSFIPAELWLYAQFLAGYLLILAIPGPNMMVVGTFAACRGLRGVMLLIASIGLGAASLSFFISLVVHLAVPIGGLNCAMTLANVALLTFTAWRIFLMKEPLSADTSKLAGSNRNDFIIGFMCGFLNPITAAYFLSHYLGQTHVLSPDGSSIVLTFGVMVLAVSALTIVACVLSKPIVQEWARKNFKVITKLISGVIAIFAVRTASSLVLVLPVAN